MEQAYAASHARVHYRQTLAHDSLFASCQRMKDDSVGRGRSCIRTLQLIMRSGKCHQIMGLRELTAILAPGEITFASPKGKLPQSIVLLCTKVECQESSQGSYGGFRGVDFGVPARVTNVSNLWQKK